MLRDTGVVKLVAEATSRTQAKRSSQMMLRWRAGRGDHGDGQAGVEAAVGDFDNLLGEVVGREEKKSRSWFRAIIEAMLLTKIKARTGAA